jgi:rhodanese-related sulfurtransferase
MAAVSDVVSPRERAGALGVYRFWRDGGFVAGAVLAGLVADLVGSGTAIVVVAALTGASGVWVWATRFPELPSRVRRKTVEDLLREARRRIGRLEPQEALDAMRQGALLVDLRSVDERRRHGVVPGSVHVPRSVLEWRADPDCPYRNPVVSDLDRHLILLCGDGYSSSFAASTLRELGFVRADDVVGGFVAWKTAGLPVRAAPVEDESGRLPGMGPPEPPDPDTGLEPAGIADGY